MDKAASDYTPHGQTSTETEGDQGQSAESLNLFTYTGAYQFNNGDVHLGHRYYSPQINQFTQADPSRQELNNYTYSKCDPTNNTDPTGFISVRRSSGHLWQSVLYLCSMRRPVELQVVNRWHLLRQVR